MKHTPGPWFASNDDATDCPDHKHSGLAQIDTGRSMDWPIARLMEWNNVPLVLAAPELLEACKFVLREQDELKETTAEGYKRLYLAVQKAEGQ